jgi:hypothetical protein
MRNGAKELGEIGVSSSLRVRANSEGLRVYANNMTTSCRGLKVLENLNVAIGTKINVSRFQRLHK